MQAISQKPKIDLQFHRFLVIQIRGSYLNIAMKLIWKESSLIVNQL